MKIGILTLPLHHNYGGILQAYALHTILQKMGHETVFIFQDRKYKLSWWKYPLVYGKRILLKYILRKKNIHIFQERRLKRQDHIIEQNIRKFTDKYIEPYVLRCNLKEMQKHLDIIIVGSDQIWRPRYMPDIKRAYLAFTKNWDIRRIAYAPSFGTDQWEYSSKQTRQCANLLKKFDIVSVREDSGIRLCDEHFKIKARQALDPTMLLNKEDYIKLFEEVNASKSEGTLLCYILDETEEKQMLINKIAKERGLIPFQINSKMDDLNISIEKRIQPSVEKWLKGFYDAEFVVTDSFHACVFSLLFNKPFIAYGNKKRGLSRFTSLLNSFGLKSQLITNINEYSKNIDYYPAKEYESRIETLRKLSYSLLEHTK